MTWIGESPCRWETAINAIQAAVKERRVYFHAYNRSNWYVDDFEDVSSPMRIDLVKARLGDIANLIYMLLRESADPTYFGEWQFHDPWDDYSKEEMLQIFTNVGLSYDDFCIYHVLLQFDGRMGWGPKNSVAYPTKISDFRIIYIFYTLLNDFILYPMPYVDFDAREGFIGIDGIEHSVSIADPHDPAKDYTKYLHDDGTYTYLARWDRDDRKIWCTDLKYKNNDTRCNLVGDWQFISKGNVLHLERDPYRLVKKYEWADEVYTLGGTGTETSLVLPVPQSVINQVLNEHGEDYDREELTLTIWRGGKIKVSESSYSAPNYTYWDRN